MNNNCSLKRFLSDAKDVLITIIGIIGLLLLGATATVALMVVTVVKTVVIIALTALWKALPYLLIAGGILLMAKILFF